MSITVTTGAATVAVTSSPTTIDVTASNTAVTVTTGGSVSVTGSAGYTHDQAVAAASWVVTHNLVRFPSVTVVDTSGNRILGFEAVYDSANQVTLTFSAAFSGKAYLN